MCRLSVASSYEEEYSINQGAIDNGPTENLDKKCGQESHCADDLKISTPSSRFVKVPYKL